ncbi:site-specific DNA-methyltransferase, partial [Thermosipho sp. (in: thermotogales)]|uniref:site-specific DNA-methyltransferase n=1 Tax=Thermosipho sp. (in: thermotogales) TaxID=1968895 RepID=UPI00257F43A5
REELFEKLYTFFKRYFSESGSIYYTYTPWSERIYERVYDPEKDVILFWKTHMLYYVKTEKNYKSVEIKIKGINGEEIKFYFDVSELEHKKANEKKEIMFEFKEIDKDKKIVLRCIYSEKGRKTKIDEIVKQAKEGYKDITTEDVEKAIRIFNKQSEVDYFINKDAEKFLKEQLDMYVYQYMFDSENVWSMKRIKEIQVFKKIANKIIEFIAQFENELVKIWNKPKFVFNSNYVITIDRIVEKEGGYEVLEKILNHENIEQQIEEWKELGIVDEGFKKEEIYQQEQSNLFSQRGYFKDIEIEILELFDDIDEELDGWLIKSENYQALNSILPKFREKVQTIYIDPPFNKEQEADYFYSVKYKDSTWATMLENRLKLSRELLNEKGSIFVRCDYNGNWIVRPLMNEIYGQENFRNEIQVNRIVKKGFGANRFPTATDSLFYYNKTFVFLFKGFRKNLKTPKEPWWHDMTSMTAGRKGGPARIIFGAELKPPEGRAWTFSQDRIYQLEKEKKIRIRCSVCGYIHYEGKWERCPECGENKPRVDYLVESDGKEPIDTDWTDIPGYSFNWNFQTENSEILLLRVIESTTNKSNIVMDFFLGSGTTIAVAHKLRRKWIGIEMGEHFYTVVLPRMKKVLAYDKSGISKEKDVKELYNEKKAGGFFKYYELEQYEEVLRNAKYEHGDLSLQPSPGKDVFNEYIFMRSPKFVETLLKREGNEYKVDLSKLYPEKKIDIVETLSNVLGKKIKKISKESFELEDIGEIRYDNIPVEYIKPLIWW